MTAPFADVALQIPVTILHVGGPRAYRRRLMEMGLVPGTIITKTRVAPLRDPIELRVRDSALSIRLAEARLITVDAPAQALR